MKMQQVYGKVISWNYIWSLNVFDTTYKRVDLAHCDIFHARVDKCGPVKPVLRGYLKRRPKLVFKTDYYLMQAKGIADCSKGSILQYFRPVLSYNLSLRTLSCLFLSGRLRQVLLYKHFICIS